jgi:hypothetical protein
MRVIVAEMRRPISNNVHHVENWDGAEYETGGVSYEEAVGYGRDINDCYVPDKARQKWTGAPFVGAHLPSQLIETLPRCPLPFNFNGGSGLVSMDLVVSERQCHDARQLLESFDLSICGCSFDGTTFRIPHPHLTFSSKAMIEPRRHALMEAFVAHTNSQTPVIHEGSCFRGSAHAAVYAASKSGLYELANIKDPSFLPLHIMERVSTKQFGTAIDQAIAESMQDDEFGLRGLHSGSSEVQKAGVYSRFHSLLFERLQKYSYRGIEFVNCPAQQLASWLKVAKGMNPSCGTSHG